MPKILMIFGVFFVFLHIGNFYKLLWLLKYLQKN